MKRLAIIALSILLFVSACSSEGPKELYDTAQFEEKQNNFSHAKELYREIVEKHSQSEYARMAQGRLSALEGR